MTKLNWLVVGLILILSLGLRTVALNVSPPALSWDETAIGYDAWAIANTGMDQWGKSWPVAFKSFGENKYPFHIYLAAIGVKLFGLSDWAIKLPLATLGVVDIGLLMYLAWLLTKKRSVALLAGLLMAISPWQIQFSRLVWETNVSLGFFLAGAICWQWSLSKHVWWRVVSMGLWGLCLYSYNAPKIFIPLWIGWSLLVYGRKMWSQKLITLLAIGVFGLLGGIGFWHPSLGGSNRFDQVKVPNAVVEATPIYQLTHQPLLGYGQVVVEQYLGYFSPQFLVISGDANLRHSSQWVGEVYAFDLILLPLGLWWCWRQRKSASWLLLGWFVLAPAPGIFFKESPHASRAMFAMGGWQIISALGLVYLYQLVGRRWHKVLIGVATIVVSLSLGWYLYGYYTVYPMRSSADFQYGYHQLFEQYQSKFDQYNQIVVTDFYSQPYIFALYHQPITPHQLAATARYSMPGDSGLSSITAYDKFRFVPVNPQLQLPAKSLIFAAPTESLPANVFQIGEINNLDGSLALKVYETR